MPVCLCFSPGCCSSFRSRPPRQLRSVPAQRQVLFGGNWVDADVSVKLTRPTDLSTNPAHVRSGVYTPTHVYCLLSPHRLTTWLASVPATWAVGETGAPLHTWGRGLPGVTHAGHSRWLHLPGRSTRHVQYNESDRSLSSGEELRSKSVGCIQIC